MRIYCTYSLYTEKKTHLQPKEINTLTRTRLVYIYTQSPENEIEKFGGWWTPLEHREAHGDHSCLTALPVIGRPWRVARRTSAQPGRGAGRWCVPRGLPRPAPWTPAHRWPADQRMDDRGYCLIGLMNKWMHGWVDEWMDGWKRVLLDWAHE